MYMKLAAVAVTMISASQSAEMAGTDRATEVPKGERWTARVAEARAAMGVLREKRKEFEKEIPVCPDLDGDQH
jgi:hypothetical protein